jgi:NADPH-dependent glutamate synthase beta subunit-like oxidoreductase
VYGIPEFRLPKNIVAQEINFLERQGVRVECNQVVGRTVSIEELFEEGCEAVYLGVGAGLPRFMNIPGENLIGILSANEYLTRANPLLTQSTPELKLNKWEYIEADPATGKTSMRGVWAGGDIVTGAATVILAMGAGRKAADSMHDYLIRGW